MNKLLHYIISKQHHKFRHTVDWNLGEEYSKKGLTPVERMADRFERLIREEKPVILPDEKICFIRTVKTIPDCFTPELNGLSLKKSIIFTSSAICQICPLITSILFRSVC